MADGPSEDDTRLVGRAAGRLWFETIRDARRDESGGVCRSTTVAVSTGRVHITMVYEASDG